MCLSLLLVSLAVRGQDTKTTRRVPLQAEVTHDGLSEKESKAWEIGLGGSLINWSRVSVTGFRSTPDNYFYNLKANHRTHPKHVAVADSKVRPYTAVRSCMDYEI